MAARIPVTRYLLRVLALGAIASCLAACQGNSDASRIGQLLYQQFTAIGGDEGVPRERVVAIPYATLGVRLGSSSEAMLVLASQSGNNLQWVGGTEFAITTRHGRIVRTSGFANNLIGFQGASDDAAAAGVQSHDYLYDLGTLDAYNVLVHCAERDVGAERLIILGDAHDTRHIVEDCTAAQVDWNFSNEFWRDSATGYVWKSLQFVHPGLDPLTLEVLRPAAE
jgi:hypothetical protein